MRLESIGKNIRKYRLMRKLRQEDLAEKADQLLEEEDYTRQKKHENKKMSGPVTVYWLIATAIYLAWSFTTNDWDRTWIIWPVVGVLFPAFYAIVSGIRKKS